MHGETGEGVELPAQASLGQSSAAHAQGGVRTRAPGPGTLGPGPLTNRALHFTKPNLRGTGRAPGDKYITFLADDSDPPALNLHEITLGDKQGSSHPPPSF